MDIRIILTIVFLVETASPLVSGNSYFNHPYSDFHPHQQRPYAEESIHYPQPASYLSPNLRKHPLWSEFWDAYNYKGPLEEEHASLPGGHFFFERNNHQKPVEYYPQRYPHRPPVTGVDGVRGDAYDRYRDYFFRRYGSNFNRGDPRY